MTPSENSPKNTRRRRVFIWLLLGGVIGSVELLLLAVVGFAAFYFGRFQGFREGAHVAPAMTAVAPVPSAPASHQNPARTAALKHLHGAAAPGSEPKSSAKVSMPAPEAMFGINDGEMPSLDQLEQTLKAMSGGQSAAPAKPSPEALAQVKKGSDDRMEAVSAYLQRVHALVDNTTGMSPQSMMQGLQAGDDKTTHTANAALDESLAGLKKLSVPPKCVDLHASYLTLIPDLKNLLNLQGKARDGDPDVLMEALSLASRVTAMQRHIQSLEKSLQAGVKTL